MKKIFSLFAAVLFAGSMMAAEVLNIDFKASQGEWTIENVELGGLDFVWAQSQQYGMKATGYVNNTNHATEALLVSPAFSLNGVESATLSFSHARRYGSLDQLSVLAKAGEGEWTALEVSAWPDGSSWSFIDATADLAAFVGQANVKVAFKYTSSAEAGATWEIASAAVYTNGEGPAVADVIFLPSDFADMGTSGTGSEISVTKDGVTVSTNKGYGHSAALRVYKNGSFSIASETEQIGKIVFSFGSYQGTPKDGGLASEIVVNAMEWSEESLASAAYVEKIEIFFGEYEPIEPEQLDTLNAQDALARAQTLEVGATEKVAVLCYIASIKTPYDANYGNVTVWLNDDVTSTYGDIQAYRAKCSAEDGAALAEHDRVLVVGNLTHTQNEEGTKDYYEIASGAQLTRLSAQGIENILLKEKVQKVVVDGVVYVVRDGKMFNLQGAQVR